MDQVSILNRNKLRSEALQMALGKKFDVIEFDSVKTFLSYAKKCECIFCAIVDIDLHGKSVRPIIHGATTKCCITILVLNDHDVILPVSDIHNAGVDHIIMKPINIHRLFELIQRGHPGRRQRFERVELSKDEITALTRGMQEIETLSPKYMG